jgi:hypothetical protein
MTLFERELDNALNITEHSYDHGKYLFSREELKSLVECISLAVIYNPELRDEIYKENN